MTTAADRRDSRRLNEAVWLVLRRYGRQITRRPWISVPALLLPGIGDVLVFYTPPLVVARLLGADAGRFHPLRADVHRAVVRRRTGVARGRGADRPGGDPRHRGALRRGDGRAAGQGPDVLPRELRRLSDQAHARLRPALRGSVR